MEVFQNSMLPILAFFPMLGAVVGYGIGRNLNGSKPGYN